MIRAVILEISACLRVVGACATMGIWGERSEEDGVGVPYLYCGRVLEEKETLLGSSFGFPHSTCYFAESSSSKDVIAAKRTTKDRP